MARILLADDEAATRDLLRRALEGDGHTVTTADDGQDALDTLVANAGRIDLLISDVQMPLLDGISLAEKALAAAPGLRVILMSAHPGGLQRAAALQLRLKATVSKPFTLDAMRATVRAALA
jgi:CheY-like chemotaxis protein